MKKVLVLHEKHSIRVFDASTEELKIKAYLAIFKERRKEGWYNDVAGDSISYAEACKGSEHAAYKLLHRRSEAGYEYERIETFEVE